MNPDITEKIIVEKTPCVFVSPHLDDAALSAGGLISWLSGKTKVSLVTIFTEASRGSRTLSAVSYLEQCGYADQDKLFSERRREDMRACRTLGIESAHLGFSDALWRKKKSPGRWGAILGGLFPELVHVYPTYRWHAISGKIAPDDGELVKNLENRLKLAIGGKQIVFCPLGVGRHVDHLITRDICAKIFSDVIFWSDFPYNMDKKTDNDFIGKMALESFVWQRFSPKKKELIGQYRTQVKSMFPSGIPIAPEVYYFRQK